MAKVSVSQRIAADADAVWELIGDFGAMAGWAAEIEACAVEGEDVGAVRTVATRDGRRLRERLESLDEVGRSYSYSALDGAPLVATLKVWANRDGSAEVVWSAELEAASAPESAACAPVEGFYRASLERLAARFS